MSKKNKEVTTVNGLREALYQQVTKINKDKANAKNCVLLTQASAQILSSYKVQITALSMSGRRLEAGLLPGLLDSAKEAIKEESKEAIKEEKGN